MPKIVLALNDLASTQHKASIKLSVLQSHTQTIADEERTADIRINPYIRSK